jgi:hypothetical protein
MRLLEKPPDFITTPGWALFPCSLTFIITGYANSLILPQVFALIPSRKGFVGMVNLYGTQAFAIVKGVHPDSGKTRR